MYQTTIICMQSLEPTIDVVNSLAPLLSAPFSGREDKPEGIAQVFHDFWRETYAKLTLPEDAWPEVIGMA